MLTAGLEKIDNKTVLVTGGTGSFGKAFVRSLLELANPEKVIIFSRDELKQHEMKNSPTFADKRVRWFLGDVRDKDRLRMAFQGVDVLIHAAALKQVDTGEYNPIEFIKTNVVGSQNVVEVAIESEISHVIALSTDKASSPINLYGATKLTADKLFVSANHYGSRTNTRFSVVRYGNVLGSRGSVLHIFTKDSQSGRSFRITDERMTRFWITLASATEFVLENLALMNGGEIFVPIIPSMSILEFAKAIDPNNPIEFTGIRPGEKLHEEMISLYEALKTIKYMGRYLILPDFADEKFYEGSEKVPSDFSYTSNNNPNFLSRDQLRTMIAEYRDFDLGNK